MQQALGSGKALFLSDVDMISIAGSTRAGVLVAQAAAPTVKRVAQELGGKSPQVLYKDADMEVAIPGAANGIFFNQGQCCNAGSRLYIEREVYDEVVQGISDEAAKIKVGQGLAPDTQMGPLISADGTRVMAHVARAAKPTGAGMVVIPDVRGLHPYYKELADRFAEIGVDSVAIDFFARTAPGEDRSEKFDFMAQVPLTKPETLQKLGLDAEQYGEVLAVIGLPLRHAFVHDHGIADRFDAHRISLLGLSMGAEEALRSSTTSLR